MPNLKRISMVLGSLAALVACQEHSQPGPVIQRDSSGVVIVESDGALWKGDGWELADTPSVSIGVTDGPAQYQFSQIIDALRLPDGRIVVANFTRPPDVRLFSRRGEHLLSLGGAGEGPGEFRAIMWVDYLPGDTLRVFDFWLARTTYFDLGGNVLSVRSLDRVAGGPMTSWVLIPGLSGGELIAHLNSTIPQDAEGRGRSITPILELDRDGALLDTITSVPYAEYYVSPEGDRTLVPFGPRTAVAAAGEWVYVSTGERYVVNVYDRTGRLCRSYRRSELPRTVGSADLEELMAVELKNARNDQQRQGIQRSYRAGPHAQRMPGYDRILVDDAGNLWARQYTAPSDSVISWAVMDDDGRLLGIVAVPAALRIMDIGGGDVLGVWRDELDVESIRVYQLLKGT